MLPLVITVIAFIALSVYLIVLFLKDILYLAVNLPVIWLVVLRSYYEIRHQKILAPYLVGAGAATLAFALWFEHIQIPLVFWPVWFITLVFLTAQIVKLGFRAYRSPRFPEPVKEAIEETAEKGKETLDRVGKSKVVEFIKK